MQRANDWIAVCALLVHMTRHGARRLDVNQGVASYLVMLIASVVQLDTSDVSDKKTFCSKIQIYYKTFRFNCILNIIFILFHLLTK